MHHPRKTSKPNPEIDWPYKLTLLPSYPILPILPTYTTLYYPISLPGLPSSIIV